MIISLLISVLLLLSIVSGVGAILRRESFGRTADLTVASGLLLFAALVLWMFWG